MVIDQVGVRNLNSQTAWICVKSVKELTSVQRQIESQIGCIFPKNTKEIRERAVLTTTNEENAKKRRISTHF